MFLPSFNVVAQITVAVNFYSVLVIIIYYIVIVLSCTVTGVTLFGVCVCISDICKWMDKQSKKNSLFKCL